MVPLQKNLRYNYIKKYFFKYKYEIGAYKCALQYFRADKYICVQGTMFLKNRFIVS